MVLAADWGVGEVLWTFIYFTLFFIWIWLAISVFADIFRSHDMGGVHKAVWVLFIILLPYLGVFIYLIVRGSKMNEHALAAAKAQEAAMQDYIRQAAGTAPGAASAGGGTAASPADELHRLADLKDRGVIDDEEFGRLKARVVG